MSKEEVVNRHDRGVSVLLGLTAMVVVWVLSDVEPYPWLLIVGAEVSGAYQTYLFLKR